MREIWKFPLSPMATGPIAMPRGARVLCVQAQGQLPCLWAAVDPAIPEVEQRHFMTYGTGHPLDDDLDVERYVGTFQLAGGALVFHVFEVSAALACKGLES